MTTHDSVQLVRDMDMTAAALEELRAAVDAGLAKVRECRQRAAETAGAMVDIEDLVPGLTAAGTPEYFAAPGTATINWGSMGPPRPPETDRIDKTP